jgi:two-component system, sensor histidine kinase and response regulator
MANPLTASASHEALVLSGRAADAVSRRAAYTVMALSAALFLLLVPFAKLALKPYPLFVPINQTVLIVNDLMTALLLFAQLRVNRSRALLVLACAYIYTALMALVHLLTFPGVFAPGGLLGGGAQTTGYLFVFWHTGFVVLAMAYTSMKKRPVPAESGFPPVAAGFTLVVCAVAAFALLATLGNDLFPPMLEGGRYTSSFNVGRFGQWALAAAAIVLLWRSRPHSVLDLWLLVVLVSWFIEIALVGIFNAGRYDLGFYAGRVYGLLSSCFVLGVLLWEQARMYAGLVAAQELERSLRAADRSKDEFLATLAHELRNPLAPIRNAVTVAKRLPAQGPEGQRLWNIVDRQSPHLSRLVEDLLEVSRITQHKVRLRTGRIALVEPLQDALDATRAVMEAAGHQVKVHLADEALYAEADATRITQVFVNLLNNASKFTPAGGAIHVRAEREDTFARFSVRDSGIGIAPEHLERIFGIFSQVTPALERSQGGLGIGLALVRGLVEMHGGSVHACSAGEGQGAEFVVRLPLALAECMKEEMVH